MYKTEFKRIAEKENGKFFFEDADISIGGGVRSPNVTYIIKFKYKENNFTIYNRTGTTYVGEIVCVLPSTSQLINFEIDYISHLANLFLRRKSRLKIKTNNENIKYFFKNNKAYKELVQISNKVNFSPTINTSIDGNKQKIVTKYHLEFEDWTQAIEPIIEFYKNIADLFEQRIANMSPSVFKEMNNY